MNQLDLSHLNQSQFIVGVPKEINRLAAGSLVNDFSVFGHITIVTTTNWTSTGRFGDLHDFNQQVGTSWYTRRISLGAGGNVTYGAQITNTNIIWTFK